MKETSSGIPPWTHVPPKINLDIAKGKKSETAEDAFRSNFNEFRAKFPNYHCIYTDGSKTNVAVAAAAVTPTYSMSKAYNKSNSIFSAELRTLILAFEYIKTTNHRNYIIFSDSKSSLQALQDLQTNNPLVCRALELHITLCNEHKNIVFCWLPSHVSIRGNEAADREAKDALTSAVSIAEVPASDWKPKAVQFVQNIRNRKWEEVQSNKRKEIVPNLKEHQQSSGGIDASSANLFWISPWNSMMLQLTCIYLFRLGYHICSLKLSVNPCSPSYHAMITTRVETVITETSRKMYGLSVMM